ncbi:hypothetical protein IQ251_09905 [Saccharopolyspora sp. HNM0983]|uniref:Uncharacterized protein n=1 Tax=Saccharopolyspora montiporae TaxID=2781240 RepID=A0A929B7P0_9PSEU|nr:hypothetical protein [Saccharopolyspora sp. HNM0983]MBE9374759.1 hypothetical protein [Saccharopolyspora sp. HNM0983]
MFHDEDLFWIVGLGTDRRHATTIRPGAVYAGQWVPALCSAQLKIPQPTPSGREPGSTSVRTLCEDCLQQAQNGDYTEVSWDF